jgi:hypothetical protein
VHAVRAVGAAGLQAVQEDDVGPALADRDVERSGALEGVGEPDELVVTAQAIETPS